MKENGLDKQIIEQWYLQLWKEFVEVDNTYQSWKKKRNELTAKLDVLRPVLNNKGISTEKLEQTARAATTSVKEDMEAKTWPNLIFGILQLQKYPIHYTEVLKTLKDRGYDVPGKDPRNTILAYLGRHKKLFSKAPEAGRGYYKLKQ